MFDDISLEDLQNLAREMAEDPEEGWTYSKGESPLKVQLQVVSKLLEATRDQLVEEHSQKVKQLEAMMRHQVKRNPKNRVK